MDHLGKQESHIYQATGPLKGLSFSQKILRERRR